MSAARRLVLRVDALRERPDAWALGLATALAATALLAVRVGAVEASTPAVLEALVSAEHPLRAVVWDVRLPRIACGALVGSALAVSGALLQTVVRNPLADPNIIGVTAGAGLAAVTTIVLFPASTAWVPALAFGGGLATVALLLALAGSKGGVVSPLRIVLSGVALQAIFMAALALLTFAYADRAPSFAAFLAGSLNGLGWQDLALVGVPTALGLALAFPATRALNLLLLDDATAGGLGLAVRPARLAASSVAALLAAGAVSVAGLVGFVGLVVPNLIRVATGPDHRTLLPLAALGGAVLVLLADTVARTALDPLELPVGALLALIGGPYFLFLLWRRIP